MATTELVTRFSFVGSLQPLQRLNQGLDVGIGMITKLGAGLGIGAIALNGFNLSLVDQIDQQNDLAITLGVSIQALQEWGFVAQLSGSSAQAYESSIGGLSQAIGDTANDVGRAKAIFEKMGISVKDATGKVKSADIVMEELRQKLKGLEKTEKISILSKLGIDRSMLTMLESSDESINKLRLQARALGITTDEEKEKVDEYKKTMDALGFAFTALATKMQIALTPAIKNMADLYVYPNTLYVLKLKGSDVKEWLEMSAGQFNTIDPNKDEEQMLVNEVFPTYNFDVIDGVSYEIDVTKAPRYDKDGKLINVGSERISNLKYNCKIIDMNAEFLVATNNYRASGGGNFPGINASKAVIASPDENRQVIVNYIKTLKIVDPKADGNWKFKKVEGNKAKVILLSSPLAKDLVGENLQYLGEGPNGYVKYLVK